MFIDSFKYLSSSSVCFVKYLAEDYFEYLSQGFDSEVLYLVKPKGFFSLWVKRLRKNEKGSKKVSFSSLTHKKIVLKSMFLRQIWNGNDEWLSQIQLKMWCLIVRWCVWKKVMGYVQVIIWVYQLLNASDEGMYLFFEKGMRGGVSYISKRYNKANNKYLKS